jgi:transposase-like protein
MKQSRKRYPDPEKLAILKRHLVEKVPISDLCDQFGIQPSQIYRWQQQLFEYGTAAFQRAGKGSAKRDDDAKDRKIAALEQKLQLKNEVVAELMEEHVQLKKELGEP